MRFDGTTTHEFRPGTHFQSSLREAQEQWQRIPVAAHIASG